MIISIEGNIGSGKSTFLSYLKSKNTKIVFVREPVDEWESVRDTESGKSIIEKFYEDQEKYSFSFQMMAFISRFSLLRKAIQENPNAIIITERCLYTDKFVFAKMLFDMKKIEDINYQIYCKWFEEFSQEIPVSKIIYIKTNPIICFSRIQQRNRKGETIIPLEYLEHCHEYHENMIQTIEKSVDIIYLDGNVDKTSFEDWEIQINYI
jgi:deoxyadenosine/deoxycytidine kinase